MNDLNPSTCDVDIRLDGSSHVRILPVRDLQHCNDLSEKSKIFLETLKDFQTVSKRVTQQLKEARQSIENKRQLAIGMHNAIEIKLENRYLAKATNQMRLEQKRRQLSQLREEHDSLLQVVEAQEIEMQRNG
eukprot:CAMPEP_0204614434 /NCGR_PEP_ID=MMETSP0717-20131115/2156_1 /ASSEMBLY_ACC=CAM_ASM_000666 /TAXON_ID=230516 /ORGANISM="Chaetoceros curvisetus" /LENGTH=131 /DNA_ID=CAMNT_0051627099 /DNA_START=58 /DNA_END=453 /DNA_ORIENTATION=-